MTAPGFVVTFFDNYAATSKRERRFTMIELAPLIEQANAPAKERLPWLKMARFGATQSSKGSYRHDGNVRWITGIEGDVDAETMTVAEAIERVTKIGVAAIVYTSPSHTEHGSRFRVLCPTSLELPPERRAHLVGRLNGLLGGVLSTESFTLSQSFYYGRVNGNPSHMVEVIDGQCIDELDELDEIWIGKPNGRKSAAAIDQPSIVARPEQITDKRLRGLIDKLLGNLRSAPNGCKHIRLLAIARTLGGYARLLPYSDAELIDLLLGALPDTVEDWPKARRTARDGLRHGKQHPLNLQERWHGTG